MFRCLQRFGLVLLLVLFLGTGGCGLAQDLPVGLEAGKPVAELPEGLSAPAGKVSLMADFASASPDKPVPVYLVNLSAKELHVPSQDGDIYVKLESRTADGRWVRAQPHQDSKCGNSYYNVLIKPGCFYPVAGYQPPAFGARTAQVRYRLLADKAHGELDLTTETAEGVCLDLDIETARLDDMALRTASLDFLARVARGEIRPSTTSPDFGDPRDRALMQLGYGGFPAEKTLPVLKELLARSPEKKQTIEYAIQGVLERTK